MIEPITNSFQLFDFNKRDDGLDNCSVYDGALELTKMMLVNVNIDEHEPKSKKFVDNPSEVNLINILRYWGK